jgi:RNA 3'-terminal phosphate cyclase (ATP)
LAALFQKNIKVVNIRGKRPRPGLQKQHLTGISLVREMCGGQLQGVCYF